MSPFGIGVEIAREEIELKMIAEATGIASTSLTPELDWQQRWRRVRVPQPTRYQVLNLMADIARE
jgi:hypothetical protein